MDGGEEVRRLRKGQVRRPRKRVITYGAGATALILIIGRGKRIKWFKGENGLSRGDEKQENKKRDLGYGFCQRTIADKSLQGSLR